MDRLSTPLALLPGTVLLAGLLSACSPKPEQGPPAGPMGGMPPAQISVVTVQPQRAPLSLEYTGQTAGYRDVEVRARVNGILQKRLYQEGGLVKFKQPLFHIDPAPFQAALDKTEADLARAEASLERAQRDVARLKPLFEANAISQKDHDHAVSDVQMAKAQVLASKAQVAQAKLGLGYTRVESPIAGLSGRAAKSEGSLVSSAEATLLTTVSQVDPIYVLFGIPDGDQFKLQQEAAAGRLTLPKGGRFKVTIKRADGTPYPHTGTVDFSDNRVNTQTGTLEGRAELANPKTDLRPGQFVQVVLSGAERPAAMLVPQRALMEGPQGKFVYVVNDKSVAEPRPVQVGEWFGDQWAIQGGLQPGDRVIVDGALKVMPGATVQVAPPATGGSPAAPEQKPGK